MDRVSVSLSSLRPVNVSIIGSKSAFCKKEQNSSSITELVSRNILVKSKHFDKVPNAQPRDLDRVTLLAPIRRSSLLVSDKVGYMADQQAFELFTRDVSERNVSLEPFTDARDVENETLLNDHLKHTIGLSVDFMGRPTSLTSTVNNITLT